MANRTIQFKRNHNLSTNSVEAKSKINSLTLANGEIVIGTYATTSNTNGIADVISVKANDKIFNVDNQTILDVIGIDDNGNVNPLVTGDTILKSIDNIEDDIDAISGDVATISGKVETLEDNLDTVSGDVNTLKTNVSTISGNVNTISGNVATISGDVNTLKTNVSTISGDVNTLKTNVSTISGNVATISGDVSTLKTNVSTVSGDVNTVSGKVETLEDKVDSLISGSSEISGDVATLSAKTVTAVEDTNSVDLTISAASDGTKKIKADVKLSTSGSAASHNENIIKETSTGLYASVDYNAAENALYVNGVKKALNAGSIVDSIIYDSTTEEIIITYHSTTSSTAQTVKVNVKDLIEEFEYPAADASHNVTFTETRVVGGKSKIQANVSNYDCGEY